MCTLPTLCRCSAVGSTSATTALLQYEIDTHLTDLVRLIGAERAIEAYRACVGSFDLLEERYPVLLTASNYQRRESLYLAENERALPALRAELQARHDIGIACRWLERAELESRYGCRRPGAILSSLGAQIDPVTGQVVASTIGPWRAQLVPGTSSVNSDRAQVVRFDLVLDKTAGPIAVRELRLVWR